MLQPFNAERSRWSRQTESWAVLKTPPPPCSSPTNYFLCHPFLSKHSSSLPSSQTALFLQHFLPTFFFLSLSLSSCMPPQKVTAKESTRCTTLVLPAAHPLRKHKQMHLRTHMDLMISVLLCLCVYGEDSKRWRGRGGKKGRPLLWLTVRTMMSHFTTICIKTKTPNIATRISFSLLTFS